VLTFVRVAARAMALLLGHLPGIEQVELDSAGNSGDTGLIGLAGGEVACLLGLPRAGPVGAVAGEEAGHEDLGQERGEGEACLVRGKSRHGAGRGGQGVREADLVRGNAPCESNGQRAGSAAGAHRFMKFATAPAFARAPTSVASP
jgi:hypothetical protein